MKNRELKEVKRSSINLLLIGVALIIFGRLSLIFITQIPSPHSQPGIIC